MDFFNTIKSRVSVRKFKDAPVEMNDIKKIVDAGRLAATARNEQPWEFVVILDRQRLDCLADMVSPNGAFLKSAAAAIVVVCRDTKYYLEDGSAATENILLAASALGLGACWIAGDKKEYCQDVLDFISATEDMKLVSVVALGVIDGEPVRKAKRPLEDVMHLGCLNQKGEI